MDRPLIQLAQACAIEITEHKNVWPEQVDDDIREFLSSTDSRAIFVVEEPDGLVIGPPPRGTDPIRTVVIAKPKGALSELNWVENVVITALPLVDNVGFKYLHTLFKSTILPLFDFNPTNASIQMRYKLVEAERALEQLLRHSEIAFIDLTCGSLVERAKTILEILQQSEHPQSKDLNELQSIVNTWKQQVSQLAASDRNIYDGTASDEIGFWIALETALCQVQEQLNCPLIIKIWQVLEKNKRFHATHNFSGDTGLTEAIKRVQGYTQILFKDLPIGEMLASNSFETLIQTTTEVFGFLNRKLRSSGYPAHRSVAFAEVIGRDFAHLLLRIATNEIDKHNNFDSISELGQAAALEYVSHLRLINSAVMDAADAWDSLVRDFATLVRELMRRRAEKFVVVKVNASHNSFVSRSKAFDNILAKYRELRPFLSDLSHNARAVDSCLTEIVESHNIFTLDEPSWQNLECQFAQEAQMAEIAIANELKYHLEVAKESNPDEILNVFTKYQHVFAFPQVRAVTHKFQSALLSSAKEELLLSEKLSQNLPKDFVEKIMRIQQLRLRIEDIYNRLKIIFGDEWQDHVDAAHIGHSCTSLLASLNPNKILNDWIDNILNSKNENLPSQEFILQVKNNNIEVTGAINDSIHVIIRKLKALGFRFEPSLIELADRWAEQCIARQRISDCLEVVYAVSQTIQAYPRILYVENVTNATDRAFEFIPIGLSELTWNSDDIARYVTEFEKAVSLLDTSVSYAIETDASITYTLREFKGETSEELLSLQKQVYDMCNQVLSRDYFRAVKSDLDLILGTMLSIIVSKWQPPTQAVHIEIRNQAITVVPSLEECVSNWYRDLSDLVNPVLSKLENSSAVMDSLSKAVNRISEAKLNAQSDIHLWVQLQPLWDLRVDDVLHTLHASTENEDSTLDMWLECLDQLQKSRRFNYSSNSRITLDTQSVNLIVDSKCDLWQDALIKGIGERVQLKSIKLSTTSSKIRDDLKSSRIDLNGVALKGLEVLNSASLFITYMQSQIPSLIIANRKLHECRYLFSKTWISSDYLQSELSSLVSHVEKCNKDLEQAKPGILKKLEAKAASLISDSQHISATWLSNKPLQANIDPEIAIKTLVPLQKKFDSLSDEICSIQNAFNSLGNKAPISLENLLKQVQDWKTEAESLSNSWADILACWNKVKHLGSQKFFEVSTSKLSQDISRMKSYCEELPESSKQLPAFSRLESTIELITTDSLPVLITLKSSDAIQARHLIQISPNLNYSKAGECQLSDIWMKLPSKDVAISLVEKAEGEYQLLKYINMVQKKWSDLILKGRNYAIRNLDSVLQLINDNLTAFNAMAGSVHFKVVSVQVQDWERKLGAARQIFDLFVDVQQQYIYLNGVLSSKAVAAILKNESKRFKGIAEEFLQLYTRAEGQPALDFAGIPRLSANLSRLLNQFTNLHRGLTGFFESQRERFPRLFFVGDDDLLEIVGSSIDIWGFKHLPSIFPGVAKIDFVDNSVISPQGEILKLHEKIIKVDDNVEMLIVLESLISNALKNEISRSILELDDAWKDPISFGKWLESFTIQSILVSLRERWTRKYLNNSGSENLNVVNEEYVRILQWLSEAGEGSLIWSRRKESVIAELIYEQQHLNPQYPKLLVGVQVLKDEVIITRGPESWKYGYEYLGAVEPIVRTKVTDDLYLSATVALSQQKGGSIVGPAGTGKTETLKSLGNIMGRRVIVFNCDDQFDYQTVIRIMSGCSATQSWACFDEFNRLSRNVLSSLAQVISDNCIRSPIFVTMNPGYSGRAILPPNMREQFRQFILAAPQSKEIARVILYAHGQIATDSADGVVQLLEILSERLSNQSHYDWSLRALKSVLRVCTMLNGDIHSACEIAIRPKLVPNDVKIFDKVLVDILGPKDENNGVKTEKFYSKISSEQLNIDSQYHKPLVNLDIFRNLFPGTMLLGPSGCGKTTIWKELARIYSAETIVIDPSSVQKSALLGSLDPITREWTDGLLSRTLRRVAKNLRGEQSKTWFIVFDGEIEPDWAEALNSLLDDNRHLTLANGEILALSPQVHLIFEATSIAKATPATISRCGIICLPDYDYSQLKNRIPEPILKTARHVTHAMNYIEVQAFNTYNKLNLGNSWLSMAWALAGDSDVAGKLEISDAIRKVAPKDIGLPSTGSLTDYFVSEITGSWHSWADTVCEIQKLDPDVICKPDVLVQTADTACHESLLHSALNSRLPLVLVGPPGSGKTMTLLSALRQMSQVANLIPLNFSSTTNPELVIQALELNCEYSQGSDGTPILAPSGSRWAVLFIDEMNLPRPNQYETVPVLQFLKYMIEYGGFYNLKGEFVKVERVQLVGACNPPPQRRAMPNSFLRHFITIYVGYPERKSLATIYSSFLSGITPEANSLVNPMLSVYEALPSIVPHETWTPRELTRWTRSIHVSWNSASEGSRSQHLLIKLWAYEAQRILCDRLLSQDKDKVLDLIRNNSPPGFDLNSKEIWSSFLTQRPQFVNFTDLQGFLQARLAVFIEEAAGEGDKNLVVHNDFILHVSQLDRILKQPQGHGLVVGDHAVGKSTLVRFSCWLAGVHLTVLRIHSQYNESEFSQDLRRTLIVALRRPCCLFLGEDILQEPDFVEQMNSLLANGEVLSLFRTAEQLAELEEFSRRAGYVGGDLFSWFRSQIVKNLHIMFSTSSESSISPALLNRCNVIRIENWSVDVRKQIAKHWCSTTDAPNQVIDLLAASFSNDICNKSEVSFIESCRQFTKCYLNHKSQLEDLQRHFVGGSDKLKAAVLEIGILKRKLAQQQDQLSIETKRSSDVLSQMLKEQSDAEHKREASIEIRAALKKQNSEIEFRRRAAREDLAAAEPLIRQAAEGVKNIKKSQLNELRAFTNPPEPVKITLEAVCLVLDLKTDGSWKQVLTAVRGDEFIPRIVKFDSERLRPELISKIERDYISLPLFTYERVDRASKACGPLLRWVVAQVAYGRAVSAVQPLMSEIEQLNDESVKSQAQLDAIEFMLVELEAAIEKSKREYSRAVGQCEKLKVDMQHITSQLQRAETLLSNLGEEKSRWSNSVSEFPKKLSQLPCKALLEAAHIAYGGCLDPKQKIKLQKQILQSFLRDDESLKDLESSLEISENTIIDNSWLVALVIDPSNTWKPDKTSSNVKISSFLLDPDTLVKELDIALRFGQHLIIQHAERFDPLIFPILSREFVRKGVRLLVNIGNVDIDVSPGFKLTLHARDLSAVIHSSPYLLPRVNVVDFSVTKVAFEHMVTGILLEARAPELAARKKKLKSMKSETASRLLTLETQLLTIISEPETEKILANEALVISLEAIKAETTQLKNTQKSINGTLDEIERTSKEFYSLATSAAEIYEKIQNLVDINRFYTISVDWLLEIAKSCAGSAEFLESFTLEVEKRILAVLNRTDWPKYSFSNNGNEPMPLIDIIRECPAERPVLAGLVTSNTSDPSSNLQTFAHSSRIGFIVIAMGSVEALKKADKLITEAMEMGEWIVIQNIEIASDEWLRRLSHQLESNKPHSNFRLVMTGLQSALVDLPELITSSRCISIERERGVKIGLSNRLNSVSDSLDFVICYIHICFAERFRDISYSDADLEAARSLVKTYKGLSNDKNLMTLKQLLLVTVWGAKTDNGKILNIMAAFLDRNLKSESVFPDNFRDWTNQLPNDIDWLPPALY